MNFQEINNFLGPAGLIVAGIIMRVSNNKEIFGPFKKYWLFFVIGGFILIAFKLYKYLK